MKKVVCLIVICFLVFSCKTDNPLEFKSDSPIISMVTPSLVTIDHTSEGFLITLNNGDILHFFRLDPTIKGDHVGNNGNISKRISRDNGKTWSNPETVYSDEYDDRNIRGGLTSDGHVIIFFRRLQANDWSPVDINYIISSDNGKTFGKRNQLDFNISSTIWEVWIDNLLEISKNKYLLPVHGVGYCEMKTFSIIDNKLKFDLNNWVWNINVTKPLGIDEPYCCKADNRIICLFRDETNRSSYYQAVSSDLGKTWSNPIRTNIAAPFFCPSPLIIYDPISTQNIIVVATDRRDTEEFSSMVWIYNNSIDSVFKSPLSYKKITSFLRPKPNNYVFYGYPIATKMKNGKWLVLITESSFDGINQDADFYQFEIKF